MYPSFSAQDLARPKTLLDEIDTDGVPDPYVRLLNALEPFLNDAQKQRLPAAKALVNLLRREEERING